MKAGSATYSPPRARDATDAIRGFVYQVQVTLLRWLTLHDGEILELEIGEDIDLISGSWPNQERLLEQIKLIRTKTVTLRSASAQEYLCNAFDHRRNNPSIALKFLFTTNAKLGREKPSPLEKGVTGIAHWQSLQGSKDSLALGPLRTLLLSGKRPAGLKETLWDDYQTYLRDAPDSELKLFVNAVAWSTRQPGQTELRHAIERRIGDLAGVGGRDQIKAIHDRIFHHVFQKICSAAPRSLNHADLRTQLVSGPADAQVTNTVEQLESLAQLRPRVEKLEMRLSAMEPLLQSILPSVDFVLGLSPAVYEVPAYGERICQRLSAKTAALNALEDGTWLSIYGRMGLGKSQLARQVAEELGEVRAWIRLRGKSERECLALLSLASRRMWLPGSVPNEQDWPEWPESFAVHVGAEVIVLDDIPRMERDGTLALMLRQLASRLAKAGGRLITTGYSAAPRYSSATPEVPRAFQCPTFNNDDVHELLHIWGAPENLRSLGFAELVVGITQGHGTLLAACLRYLENSRWNLSSTEMDSLIRGEFASSEADEIRRALMLTLPDERTRELLYRVLLVGRAFSLSDARLVASVTPEIPLVRERLAEADGVWLQAESAEWHISPLLDVVGADLLPSVASGCHRKLAETIKARKELYPEEGIQLSRHLIGCGEKDLAGGVLALLCIELMRASSMDSARRYVRLLLATQPSEELNSGIALFLRAQRFALATLYNYEGSSELMAFDALLNGASPDSFEPLASIGACVTVCLRVSDAVPERITRYALFALERARHLDADHVSSLDGLEIEQLMWLGIARNANDKHLEEWYSSVEKLTVKERHRLQIGSGALVEALTVADLPVMDELEKDEVDRTWVAPLATLDRMILNSRRLGVEVLEAAAIRSRLDVMRTMKDGDIERALNEAIALKFDDVRCRAVIIDKVAEVLLTGNSNSRAADLLLPVVGNLPDLPFNMEANIRLRAATSLEFQDAASAVRLIEEMLVRLSEENTLTDFSYVRAISVYAVIVWRLGDARRTLNAVAHAVELLIERFDDQESAWKFLAKLQLHAFSYIGNTFRGLFPQHFPDGSVVEPPSARLFWEFHDSLARRFDDGTLASLAVCVATFADTVGDAAEAEDWAERAIDLVRNTSDRPQVYIGFLMSLTPLLLRRRLVGEVIKASFHLWEMTAAAFPIPPSQSDASQTIMLFAVLPVAIEMLWASLDEGEAALRMARTAAAELRMLCGESTSSALSQIADFVEFCYLESPSRTQVETRAAGMRDHELYEALGLLSLGWRNDISLSWRLRAHCVAVERLMKVYLSMPSISNLLAGAIVRFWGNVFAKQRFAFHLPRSIDADLKAAGSLEPVARAKATLLALADGLDVPIAEDFRKWLRDW